MHFVKQLTPFFLYFNPCDHNDVNYENAILNSILICKTPNRILAKMQLHVAIKLLWYMLKKR